MILQPIVENAVQHGIHDNLGEGCITLTVRRPDENLLEISVRDNGVGMTQEKIRDVLEGNLAPAEEDSNSTGVAMSNVIHRLELYYNQKDLLHIESDGTGCGTEVILTLPVTSPET